MTTEELDDRATLLKQRIRLRSHRAATDELDNELLEVIADDDDDFREIDDATRRAEEMMRADDEEEEW